MKGIQSTVVAAVFVLVLAGSAHAFWGFGGSDSVTAENGVVSIPVSEVSDGDAHFYRYDAGGKDVKFFVMKSRDGIIRAAFDACDVCYGEKKGYTQDGDFLVCNNCGQRFHSSRINEVKGGCNPSPLAREYDARNVTIKAGDLAAGAGYF
ncbi:Fe-S-containing protein [Pseudodesulfovibrio karagichevae]|uniref:Fe-S-containing protein n=1 Tax=Pseudodesulfovibrio karagichevae TaxID=3239305 RepID=A0ABV4JZH7_9BACT